MIITTLVAIARWHKNWRIDLVSVVMGPALDFLLRYGAELFPGAPIVFCGIRRQEIERVGLWGQTSPAYGGDANSTGRWT